MPVESFPSIEITKKPEASVEFSIVMPCLNEAETLSTCIQKAQHSLEQNNVTGEIIIADNGSTDGSQDIATQLGARVIDVQAKGYGNALMGGIAAARGKYVIMGDADDSYDFASLGPFIRKLREGYDLVMGNRFLAVSNPARCRPCIGTWVTPCSRRLGVFSFAVPSATFTVACEVLASQR